MKIFTRNLGFPEAPVHLPDGDFLFVEMSPDKGWRHARERRWRDADMLAKTGRPNGLALDRNGLVWVAESAMRAVLRMTLEGQYEVVANQCRGEGFLFLNDLAFGPNGDLFVTDSGILLDEIAPGGELVPNWRDLNFDGRVYRIDVRTRQVDLIDRGIQFTNGIAFGPNGDLFVAETLSGNIYRYACRNGGSHRQAHAVRQRHRAIQSGRAEGAGWHEVREERPSLRLRLRPGQCHRTGYGGKVVERIATDGACPTNLAFARDGRKQIYVTEVVTGTVQVFDVDTEGLPLHG